MTIMQHQLSVRACYDESDTCADQSDGGLSIHPCLYRCDYCHYQYNHDDMLILLYQVDLDDK